MKKIVTLLFMLVLTSAIFAQNICESYDGATFPPSGWTVAGTGISRVTAGTYPTCAPHSGAAMVMYNSFNIVSGSAQLVSPAQTLATGTGNILKFWMYRDGGYATSTDKLDVNINTSASTTGATLLGTINRSMSLAPVVATAGWYEYSFTIPASFTGSTSYLIFNFTSNWGNNIFVDDILVGVPAAPSAAVIGAPANNATGVNLPVTLSWTAPTCWLATGYKVYLGTTANPTTLVSTQAGTTYTPAGLAYNTRYYWKVVPYNTVGDATTVPTWTFTSIGAIIAGKVTDCNTGDGIMGVMVTTVPATGMVMTDDNGNYSLSTGPGTYSVVYTLAQYQTVTKPGIVANGGATTTVNTTMCENPYAPSCANATVNATDTQCVVNWCMPGGPYEMLYDDGTAENYAAWTLPGNMIAVKFTPKGYPALVKGARFYVGDGTFPVGGNIIGSTFTVKVLKDDGVGGLPGTQVGTNVTATVTATGWITVTTSASITAGSFYIVMVQNQGDPNCTPIGVDESLPKAYKSYSKFVTNGGGWVLSVYQDYMIHAIVEGPVLPGDAPVAAAQMTPSKLNTKGQISMASPNTIGGYEMDADVVAPLDFAPESLTKYKLYRVAGFNPNNALPGTGVFTLLSPNLTVNTYTDGGTAWSSLPQGFYAYGIRAFYTNGDSSQFAYTNVVPHKMKFDVTVNVKLVCNMVPAVGATVRFAGTDYPYDVFTVTVPASGTVTQTVIKGNYTITVSYQNYTTQVWTYNITANKTIDIVLEDTKYVPRNLFVNDRSLKATWDPALFSILDQNFETATPFPPTGWSKTSNNTSYSWFSQNAAFAGTGYSIPAHTRYALTHDDGAADVDACCDYLITPTLDLTVAAGFHLTFARYAGGEWGGVATVEYSTNGGTTWTVLKTLTATTNAWVNEDVDLSSISGNSGLSAVKLAFHYNDMATWADAFAVDDIKVQAGAVPALGYGVYLDGTFTADVAKDVLTYTYLPTDCLYGKTYTAGVAGKYCSGYSALCTYVFTSHWLYPPRNLTTTPNQNAAILNWLSPLGPGSGGDAPATDYSYIQNSSNALSAAGPSANVTPSTSTTNDAPNAAIEIKYTSDTYNNAIGLTAGGTLMAAARFTATELGSYYGNKKITKVMLYLGPGFTTVNLKIWEGGTSPTNAGTEVYSQNVTSQIVGGSWVTLTLTGQGINLVASKEYWIGYELIHPAGVFPLAFDAGCTATGKSDLIYNAGAWTTLTAVGFPGDLMIKGVIDDAGATGLVSYVLYRDGVQVAEIPKPTLNYWDQNLLPKNYCWDVTAKYNVALINPATTGLFESLKEGPACANIVYGKDLPFTEDWTTGQFDVNGWVPDAGGNWVMDGQNGKPAPSAKFKWDPLLSGAYAKSLTSTFFNATTITTTTPYKIYLDCDLKLDDKSATNLEKLNIEVSNNAGSTWTSVKQFTNNGDFDWTAQHIDISTLAKGKVFSVRFRANGVLSGDIFYWAVDNVKIYVQYSFNPPLNLVAAAEGTPKNDIKLTWSAPSTVADAPDALVGYKVWRRAYAKFPAGSNAAGAGTFDSIATVTALTYTDMNLTNLVTNCYEYKVTATYTEGQSVGSNVAWQCIFVGVNPSEFNEVKLYPNPATNYVRIDLTSTVNSITIYNSLGSVVATQNVKGENTVTINTSNYAAGAYNVKFTTTSGESFSRKFVVTK